jgi:hypothetical protein
LFSETGLTCAEDLERVARWSKPEFSADGALHLFQLRGEELDRVATRSAHHVMVRSPIQAELVARDAVVKIDFVGKSALGQQLDGPVDSRVANAWIALFDNAVEILGAEVIAREEKHLENPVALCTLLEPFFPEMSGEDLLRFDGQLSTRSPSVVNAFSE